MPAADIIHSAVRQALIKDGWTITADPYTIEYRGITLFADLGAERPLAAERAGRKIVVEIKSFLNPSPIRDLELALGQYDLYRGYLELTAPERELYLAVGSDVYDSFFEQEAIQVIVERYSLRLIVVNLESEEISKWIS